MSNPSKRRGSSWEQAIVDFLRESGWPHTERRVPNGSKDRGDVAWLGPVIEAKNCRSFDLAGWMTEAQTEAANARSPFGVVWIKRRGRASAGHGYVVMDGAAFVHLLREAGW